LFSGGRRFCLSGQPLGFTLMALPEAASAKNGAPRQGLKPSWFSRLSAWYDISANLSEETRLYIRRAWLK